MNIIVYQGNQPALCGIGTGMTGRTTACAGEDPVEAAGGAAAARGAAG